MASSFFSERQNTVTLQKQRDWSRKCQIAPKNPLPKCKLIQKWKEISVNKLRLNFNSFVTQDKKELRKTIQLTVFYLYLKVPPLF